jgi:hypothetical protein
VPSIRRAAPVQGSLPRALSNTSHAATRITNIHRSIKVCRNRGPHLRGNLYVQFHNVEDAERAARAMHERYYGGKQIFVQFSPGSLILPPPPRLWWLCAPCLGASLSGYLWRMTDGVCGAVTSWRTALCGQYVRGECSRGGDCNYLHPFRNPGTELSHSLVPAQARLTLLAG